MRRLILLLAAMGAAKLLLVSGVAYALSVQCDGINDQDPDPGQCQGTDLSDVITGTEQSDIAIDALGGRDEVNARGGNDAVVGGRGGDDISGGVGGDGVNGGGGPDEIEGGPGTTDPSGPLFTFECNLRDPDGGTVTIQGTQFLQGDDGNDELEGGRDNDLLVGGTARNDLSGKGGEDCLLLIGDENERASAGDGDDLIGNPDGNGDDIFCGAGHDTVNADVEDRVAANCEDVVRFSLLQATGSTPAVEVTITTPEGTTTMTP